MKTNKTVLISSLKILGLLLILMPTGCSISRFKVKKSENPGFTYSNIIKKEDIKPLKQEWKELYTYLKRGHIRLIIPGEKKINYEYICSKKFNRFLKQNELRIYNTPFLRNLEGFTKAFGPPSDERHTGEFIWITYNRFIVDKTCETCPNNGLYGYKFDCATKELLKY